MCEHPLYIAREARIEGVSRGVSNSARRDDHRVAREMEQGTSRGRHAVIAAHAGTRESRAGGFSPWSERRISLALRMSLPAAFVDLAKRAKCAKVVTGMAAEGQILIEVAASPERRPFANQVLAHLARFARVYSPGESGLRRTTNRSSSPQVRRRARIEWLSVDAGTVRARSRRHRAGRPRAVAAGARHVGTRMRRRAGRAGLRRV